MMRQQKKLTDAYPDWFTGGGVFSSLVNRGMPWSEALPEFDGIYMDIEYYGNRSGTKEVSAILDYAIEKGPEALQQTKNYLIELIIGKYKIPWQRAWDAMIAEYNPINNYKMIKKEIEDSLLKMDKERTIEKTTTDGGTITREDGRTISNSAQETGNNSSENHYQSDSNTGIYGFDSTASANANRNGTTQDNSSSGNHSVNNSSEIIEDGDETITRNLQFTDTTSDTDDASHKKTGTYDTTTEGNIGVTTSQEMIESEINLRFDYSFFDKVYKDVDKILTCGVFVDRDEDKYNYF